MSLFPDSLTVAGDLRRRVPLGSVLAMRWLFVVPLLCLLVDGVRDQLIIDAMIRRGGAFLSVPQAGGELRYDGEALKAAVVYGLNEAAGSLDKVFYVVLAVGTSLLFFLVALLILVAGISSERLDRLAGSLQEAFPSEDGIWRFRLQAARIVLVVSGVFILASVVSLAMGKDPMELGGGFLGGLYWMATALGAACWTVLLLPLLFVLAVDYCRSGSVPSLEGVGRGTAAWARLVLYFLPPVLAGALVALLPMFVSLAPGVVPWRLAGGVSWFLHLAAGLYLIASFPVAFLLADGRTTWPAAWRAWRETVTLRPERVAGPYLFFVERMLVLCLPPWVLWGWLYYAWGAPTAEEWQRISLAAVGVASMAGLLAASASLVRALSLPPGTNEQPVEDEDPAGDAAIA